MNNLRYTNPLSREVWLICALATLHSCGAAKVVVNEPTSFEIVSSHLESGDPKVLLGDLAEYPEHTDLIENQLYHGIVYHNFTYNQIKELAELAQEDFRASVYFDSLLVAREEGTLKYLQPKSINEVGAFYRANGQTMDFLRDNLKEAYFDNIAGLDYYGLKTLHSAFLDTDLDSIVLPTYLDTRKRLLAAILSELEPYFMEEEESLDNIDTAIRSELEDYIEEGVVSVAAGLSEKLDRGILKRVFKRRDIDNYSITEYTERLVGQYIDGRYISDYIIQGFSDYVTTSTEIRGESLSNYLDNAKTCQAYYIPEIRNANNSFLLTADKSQASRIQSLKTFNDATAVTSVTLAFTPVGWVSLAVDALDFYNGFTEESKVQTMLDRLTESLYASISDSIDAYMKELYSNINHAREESKDFIIKQLNENF